MIAVFVYHFQFSHVLTAPCFQIVTITRTLYQKCKLVHGDLSEYNILYFEVMKTCFELFPVILPLFQKTGSYIPLLVQGHLHIIDVSQSVDLDHPLALDFLKEDCLHVSVSEKLDRAPHMCILINC